jgi:hypothetical protein
VSGKALLDLAADDSTDRLQFVPDVQSFMERLSAELGEDFEMLDELLAGEWSCDISATCVY